MHGTWASELMLFLRTDLFYTADTFTVEQCYAVECFPCSSNMCLAFPWNHINDSRDNMPSIPYALSGWFFIHKKYCLYSGLRLRERLQKYSTYSHHRHGRSVRLGCWEFESKETFDARPEPPLALWFPSEVHYYVLLFQHSLRQMAVAGCAKAGKGWSTALLVVL